MKYKILAREWRSALHSVGFIAYATNNPRNEGDWNSVVGYVPDKIVLAISDEDDKGGDIQFDVSMDEERSCQYIAANGAKIEWQLARELFPQLDILKHKYLPKQI